MGFGGDRGEGRAVGGDAEAANESAASKILRSQRLAPFIASTDFTVAVLSSRVVEAC